MKNYFILLISVAFASCTRATHEVPDFMDVSIINDVTDPHMVRPDPNSILALYNIPEHKEDAANFRYTEITDKVLVPVVELHLASSFISEQKNHLNEPLYREHLILEFYSAIRKTLPENGKNIGTSTLGNSECFTTIANALQVLSKSNSGKRYLLIYSNLFENSSFFSIYDHRTKSVLTSHPERIITVLENSRLLPNNLKNIQIVFLFKPKDRDEDKLFSEMIHIYTKELGHRGATITVQAQNSFLN